MGQLIMWNLVTQDGYFSGPNGELDFMEFAWGPELESFINAQAETFGTIVFGRKTYEGMAEYWSPKTDFIGRIMNETPKVVFSRSLRAADWKNARIAGGELRGEAERIKRESTKDAFVLGSGALCTALAQEDLIDEYRFGVVSMMLGEGVPLFGTRRQKGSLRLIESRALSDRVALLRCRPSPDAPA